MSDLPRPQKAENFVHYGDGPYAALVDVHPCKEDNSYIFRLRPNDGLMFKHNVRRVPEEGYDSAQDWFVKKYPDTKCICLNTSPMFNSWFITCDWNGNDAPGETLFYRALRSRIDFLQEELKSKETMILRQQFYIRELSGNLESIDAALLARLKHLRPILGNTTVASGGSIAPPMYPEEEGGEQ